MLRALSDTLLAPLALASILAAVATLLHVTLVWRERLRPTAVALVTRSSQPQRPNGGDVRWLSHQARGPRGIEVPGAVPTVRSDAQERPVGVSELAGPRDDDLTGLDAVDRASAFSFPASDPPALSGPARASAAAELE